MRVPFALFLLTGLARASDIAWVTTDFTTGGLALERAGECSATELSLPVAGDAVVRCHGDYLYLVERLGYDNITVLSAAHPDSVIAQFSTGSGTNPQDIMPASATRAYVTLFERAGLLVVNPLTGAHLGTVDLSVFADADGIPEMTRMIRLEDRILVVCQRLDRSSPMMDPAGPGCLAAIAAETGEVIDADPATPVLDPFWLPEGNPTASAIGESGLLVTCTGTWSLYDDGLLVELNPASGQTTVLLSEATLGANMSGIAVAGETGFLIVSNPDWTNGVVSVDLTAGTVGLPVQGLSTGYVPDLLVHDGLLYIADQGTWTQPERAGVVVVDAQTLGLTCGTVSTGLPPMSAAVITPQTAPPVPPEAPQMRIWPNPASTMVYLSLPEGARHAVVTVLDLAGRIVAGPLHAHDGAPLPLGSPDGRVAPGSYLLRVTGPGYRHSQPLVVR
jgi:hypothetical protein